MKISSILIIVKIGNHNKFQIFQTTHPKTTICTAMHNVRTTRRWYIIYKL